GAGSETGNDRAAHYVLHVRERVPGTPVLAIPLLRVDTPSSIVERYIDSYRWNFRGSVPAALEGEGVWGIALPDVWHTVEFPPLPLQAPGELRAAYDRLALTVQQTLAAGNQAAVPHDERTELFADARRRVRWDVFIAYSSVDTA